MMGVLAQELDKKRPSLGARFVRRNRCHLGGAEAGEKPKAGAPIGSLGLPWVAAKGPGLAEEESARLRELSVEKCP